MRKEIKKFAVEKIEGLMEYRKHLLKQINNIEQEIIILKLILREK